LSSQVFDKHFEDIETKIESKVAEISKIQKRKIESKVAEMRKIQKRKIESKVAEMRKIQKRKNALFIVLT